MADELSKRPRVKEEDTTDPNELGTAAQKAARKITLKKDAQRKRREIRNALESEKGQLATTYRSWYQAHQDDLDETDGDPMMIDGPENKDDDDMYGGASGGGGNGGGNGADNGGNSAGGDGPGDDEGIIDPNAPPIVNGAGYAVFAGEPLAGLARVSVAKRQGKRRDPVYINRIGPPQREWYVFGAFEGGGDADLLDVMKPYNRRISRQYKDGEEEPKAKNFRNIIQVAFDYNVERDFPIEACKLLDPADVKQGLTTLAARRKHTKEKGTRLKSFPPTVVLVDWWDHPRTWELASELKNFKKDKALAIETLIYQVAWYRAHRIELLIGKNRESILVMSRLGTEDAPRYVSEGRSQSRSQTPLPSIENNGQQNAITTQAQAVTNGATSQAQAPSSPTPSVRFADQPQSLEKSAAVSAAQRDAAPASLPTPDSTPPPEAAAEKATKKEFIIKYCKERKLVLAALSEQQKLQALAAFDALQDNDLWTE